MASTALKAPLAAVVAGPMGGITNHGWSGTSRLRFRVTLKGTGEARNVLPEIELLPANHPFSGSANIAGRLITVPAHNRVVAQLPVTGLREGELYHWRVRLRDANGSTSTWTGSGTFGLSSTPPATPHLISANALSSIPTKITTPSLHWNQPADPVGIAYYEWASSTDPAAPPTWHRSNTPVLHLHGLGSGLWHVRVRAVDRAGNRSGILHWSVLIDRSTPSIRDIALSTTHLATGSAPARLRFTLNKPAMVTLHIVPNGHTVPPAPIDLGYLAAGLQTIAWSGTDGDGHLLPTGRYRLRVEARDTLGNAAEQPVSAFSIDSRRIVVSLTKQDLTVYDGAKKLLYTAITSGGPQTKTPIGIFHIMAKFAPMVMHSPWPKSSPLWYPDSPVNFALLFRDGGYFLHDAPWRSVFGPGSNAVDGIPGGNTTGTHGCVNVPYAAESWLYNWTQIGTTVQIVQ